MNTYTQDASTLPVPYTKELSRYREILLFHYEPSTSILLHHNRLYPAQPRTLRISFEQFRILLKGKARIHRLIRQARPFPDVFLRHEIDGHLRITINSNIEGITLRNQSNFIFLKYPEWYNLVNAAKEFMENIPGLQVEEPSSTETSVETPRQPIPVQPDTSTTTTLPSLPVQTSREKPIGVIHPLR